MKKLHTRSVLNDCTVIIGLLIIIFSFTILTVAGRHYVKNGDSYEQKRGAFMKKLRWMISVPVAVIMAVVLLVSGIRIIDSTEVGVVRTWGQINREIDAGFNLINPVSESVQKYDLRVHVRQGILRFLHKGCAAIDCCR